MGEKSTGQDFELNQVAEEFFAKVVPRPLRPLQTGGRRIEPVLVQGDFWDENIRLDRDTGKLTIFDACCCYEHRECKSLYTGVVSNECRD